MVFNINPRLVDTLGEAETRFVPDARGEFRPVTTTRLHWMGYDYLIDNGYATHERIVEHAQSYRWPKTDPDFEQRMMHSIAEGVRAFNHELGTWKAYTRGG